MPTSEERLTTLEKTVATITHDIAYKIDDTNSAVTIIKGVMGALAQDTKIIRSQMKTMESQIKTMDLRLDGIDTRLARVEEQLNEQGQDIRDIKRRLDSLEDKFDQMLVMLTTLTNKPQ
jgi:chromosome segregation ATPase